MPLRTPLYDWHVARGARMVDFGGWDMPVQYTSIVEEHHAVRQAAGLFDVSHMGRLSFDGPGALPLIQHVYTNDAGTMKDGQARYGLICNPGGGVRDDGVSHAMECVLGELVVVVEQGDIVAGGELEGGVGRRGDAAGRGGLGGRVSCRAEGPGGSAGASPSRAATRPRSEFDPLVLLQGRQHQGEGAPEPRNAEAKLAGPACLAHRSITMRGVRARDTQIMIWLLRSCSASTRSR